MSGLERLKLWCRTESANEDDFKDLEKKIKKQGVVEELKRQLKVYEEVKSNLEKDNGFSDYISGQLFAVKMVIFGLENSLEELEEVKK
jgi:hypothetical protein